jgi:hypothetical protein
MRDEIPKRWCRGFQFSEMLHCTVEYTFRNTRVLKTLTSWEPVCFSGALLSGLTFDVETPKSWQNFARGQVYYSNFFQRGNSHYRVRASSYRDFTISQTRHTRYDSSGRVISPKQGPLPDNTQHSQKTDIHAAGRIRTHNPSKRAATNLCLRPCGDWDKA